MKPTSNLPPYRGEPSRGYPGSLSAFTDVTTSTSAVPTMTVSGYYALWLAYHLGHDACLGLPSPERHQVSKDLPVTSCSYTDPRLRAEWAQGWWDSWRQHQPLTTAQAEASRRRDAERAGDDSSSSAGYGGWGHDA